MSAVFVWWVALQWSYALAIVLAPLAILCLIVGTRKPRRGATKK